ncbi:hypothetical protein FRC08_017585, partial [Ceratobasidium sp. 394]
RQRVTPESPSLSSHPPASIFIFNTTDTDMVVLREGISSKDRPISPDSERKPKGIRSKEGCLTCRIRRKKCDQGKHEHSCESCRRLHIECLGYSRNRPEWLK